MDVGRLPTPRAPAIEASAAASLGSVLNQTSWVDRKEKKRSTTASSTAFGHRAAKPFDQSCHTMPMASRKARVVPSPDCPTSAMVTTGGLAP